MWEGPLCPDESPRSASWTAITEPLHQRQQLHHDLGQHQFVIELAGDQAQIRFQAGFQAGDELRRLESMRLLRRKPKRVAID